MADLWWYRAALVRILDGDSFVAMVDLGMSVHTTQHLRLLDVWAPERNQPGGTDATNELAAWLGAREGKWPLLIRTEKDKRSFARYIADVFDIQTGDHLNDHMRRYLAARETTT